jgi:hypothetical protein
MQEIRLKDKLLGFLKGDWTCSIEPAKGSSVGLADLLIMNRFTKVIVPVELKLGRSFRDHIAGVPLEPVDPGSTHLRPPISRVRVKHFQPTQIYWHDHLQRAGGHSRIVVGVYDNDWGLWDCWYTEKVDRNSMQAYLHDVPIEELVRFVTNSEFDREAWDQGAFGPGDVVRPDQLKPDGDLNAKEAVRPRP